ncbi:hypothetical protein CAOG_08503, partial [Capsaspora owczarzaki ATCC 30864]
VYVIHTATGARWICATIGYAAPVVTVQATFSGMVNGTITFKQLADQPQSETTALVRLARTDGQTTVDHQWHVHTTQLNGSPNCADAGGHFNPSGISESLDLGCLPFLPDLCTYTGNLYGRFGALTLTPTLTKAMFTGLALPLSGPTAITPHSVVIHDQNLATTRLACADLGVVAPRVSSAVFAYPDRQIYGSVVFSQVSAVDPVLVSAQVFGLFDGEAFPWHVHILPVDGTTGSCASTAGHWSPNGANAAAAGYSTSCNATSPYRFTTCEAGDLTSKFGKLYNGQRIVGEDYGGLTLFGPRAILGRSVVIHRADTTRYLCATMDALVPSNVAQATFSTPFNVNGVMTFRQALFAAGDALPPTTYSTTVAKSDGSAATFGHNYHVHLAPVNITTNDCASTLGHFDPYGAAASPTYATDCTPLTPWKCELGDLSGKQGQLNIPTTMSLAAQGQYADVNLPLSGPQTIVGRAVTIHAAGGGSTRYACATLKPAAAKTANAYFNSQGVVGVISFSQTNQYDPVAISVQLDGVTGSVSNRPWHVHTFPVETDCSAASVGGHFNPFNAPASSAGYATTCNANSASRHVSCETGDLSGKFGPLVNGKIAGQPGRIVESFVDPTISLYGINSIAGRSVVIHQADGTRWICATIGLARPVITVRADFAGVVNGSVTLKQLADDPLSPTSIHTKLFRTDGTTTNNHNWHVHINPVATPGDCASTGAHYNPLGVDTSNPTTYASLCTPQTPANCELGDLTLKHYQLNITTSATKTFTSDVMLPLSGTNSVAGRSIVIHDQNGGAARIACASLYVVQPKTVQASFSAASSTGGNVPWATGTITLSQTSPSDPTFISVALSNVVAPLDWSINAFPVEQGCAALSVGSMFSSGSIVNGARRDLAFDPNAPICSASSPFRFASCVEGNLSGKHGTIMPDSTTFADNNLQLFGRWSVSGRSIVLRNNQTGQYACATLSITSVPTITAIARFSSPVVTGTITLTQEANDPTAPTSVYVNVFRMDGTTSNNHMWHIHVNPKNGTDCLTTGGHYNPLGVDLTQPAYGNTCTPSTPFGCELGDLFGKHTALTLGGMPRSQRFFETDVQLPLSGPNSVMGRSIVIHNANLATTRLACADIVPAATAQARTLTAVFNGVNGVVGTITFSQATPTSPTNITVDLAGLNSQAESTLSWHIHQFEVASPGDCSAPSTGGHYDPFAAAASPTYATNCNPASGTKLSSCEIGDLSGKWGKLTYAPMYIQDPSVTLFGPRSIMGRSVVVHLASSARWVCASIGYPKQVKVVRADFTGSPVSGSITLRQSVEDPDGETTILTNLVRTDGGALSQNPWHVHILPVAPDCASTTGHYNPYTAALGLCSPQEPYLCELGDLANRQGYLGLSTAGGKSMLVDTFLPLSGPTSVTDRSIVIHDATTPTIRIACATLSYVTPRIVTAVFDGANTNGVTGTITLTQQTINDPTWISVALSGVAQIPLPLPFHVHAFPIDSAEADRCGAASTGGHYIPLPIDYTQCTTTSARRFQACEVGDLSGKLGRIAGYSLQGWDYMLPLFGRYSVAGRSIVIHRTTSERWVCASLGYPNDAPVVRIVANFTSQSSLFTGAVTLTQIASDPTSETYVQVKLARTDSAASTGHKWHVHVNPVQGDGYSSNTTRCLSTGGHYNPTNAPVSDPIAYAACSSSNVTACELGDLAGKLAQLNFTAGNAVNKQMWTDTWLPLTGPWNVTNRAIVIHDQNQGSTRLGCASFDTAFVPVTPSASATPSQGAPAEDSSSSNAGAIAGGVVGGLVGGLLLILLVIFLLRRRRGLSSRKRVHRSPSSSGKADIERNDAYVSPASSVSVQMKPMSAPPSRAPPSLAAAAAPAAAAQVTPRPITASPPRSVKPAPTPRPSATGVSAAFEVYRAIYPYAPQYPDELELAENDIVLVTAKAADGWFTCKNTRTKAVGKIPGNYCELDANADYPGKGSAAPKAAPRPSPAAKPTPPAKPSMTSSNDYSSSENLIASRPSGPNKPAPTPRPSGLSLPPKPTPAQR